MPSHMPFRKYPRDLWGFFFIDIIKNRNAQLYFLQTSKSQKFPEERDRHLDHFFRWLRHVNKSKFFLRLFDRNNHPKQCNLWVISVFCYQFLFVIWNSRWTKWLRFRISDQIVPDSDLRRRSLSAGKSGSNSNRQQRHKKKKIYSHLWKGCPVLVGDFSDWNRSPDVPSCGCWSEPRRNCPVSSVSGPVVSISGWVWGNARRSRKIADRNSWGGGGGDNYETARCWRTRTIKADGRRCRCRSSSEMRRKNGTATVSTPCSWTRSMGGCTRLDGMPSSGFGTRCKTTPRSRTFRAWSTTTIGWTTLCCAAKEEIVSFFFHIWGHRPIFCICIIWMFFS